MQVLTSGIEYRELGKLAMLLPEKMREWRKSNRSAPWKECEQKLQPDRGDWGFQKLMKKVELQLQQ